ncbi:hypothetical protein FISHEDRAFT_56740 [Fistulina hepatica ATCC 64428]|uniref:Uncharacterized protein n=1 Tax=Fistulina hepatica ATCC 64428 TaxID=1128425 RepID=A0A0D7AIT4_9AGAR|nr:hypothetical protein FISHEDRAFT_56740 [Fistulina hepatica ATCC 64428]
MADLSSLLSSSKALNSQFVRPDLSSVHPSLDQIEAQSRRLAAARTHQPNADQPFGATDSTNGTAAAYSNERANYLLAQAQVDAPNLAESVSNLNAILHHGRLCHMYKDVVNYLRYSHEQNLITTIEEARKETQAGVSVFGCHIDNCKQDEFYRLLEEKGQREWEAKKKRVFEELGGRRITSGQNDTAELHRSFSATLAKSTSLLAVKCVPWCVSSMERDPPALKFWRETSLASCHNLTARHPGNSIEQRERSRQRRDAGEARWG